MTIFLDVKLFKSPSKCENSPSTNSRNHVSAAVSKTHRGFYPQIISRAITFYKDAHVRSDKPLIWYPPIYHTCPTVATTQTSISSALSPVWTGKERRSEKRGPLSGIGPGRLDDISLIVAASLGREMHLSTIQWCMPHFYVNAWEVKLLRQNHTTRSVQQEEKIHLNSLFWITWGQIAGNETGDTNGQTVSLVPDFVVYSSIASVA